MKINNLIDRDITYISVSESIAVVDLWLRKHQYLAVTDEAQHITGIITLNDLQANPSLSLRQIDISKPKVSQGEIIFDVFKLMKEAQTDFLPVYEKDGFIGVIALMTIMERLVEVQKETKQHYQKVIHDLRNPIGNLRGLINLLHETITDKESRDLIKLSSLSCKHTMDILDDLMFAEIDESKPLVKQPTEMNSFYKQCVDEQLGLGLLKQVTITTELCEEKVERDIDRIQLKRAVQNVISNAIKFSYPNSTIKITSKVEKGQLILKVLDAGVGIPEKFKDDIFKKFTPVGRIGTNGEPSIGLGLYFTKLSVEQHSGSIYFKSTEGKGTKFYIRM